MQKKGISLIVLVITIIVMIILAAAVVISMSNNGIIDKASHAVQLTDEKQVQDLAALAWAEAYLDDKRTDPIETVVKAELEKHGVTDEKWDINVTDTGITVTSKLNASIKQDPYGYLSGTWKFNEVLTIPEPHLIYEDIKFSYIINGETENRNKIDFTTASDFRYLTYTDVNGSVHIEEIVVYNETPQWFNQAYRTINFGTEAQQVTPEFYDWFIVNAVKISN